MPTLNSIKKNENAGRNSVNYSPEPKYFNVNFQPIIGKNVSLVNTLLDCVDQITIGDNVGFGHNVMLLTGTHDYTLKGEERFLSHKWKPIRIENGVWIASGVIVLSGVTIGENSVIGAGSVVTKDIPPNELWCGVPARFKKKI